MDYLVGELVLKGGEKVVITFSDGTVVNAVYKDTYGYNHMFLMSNGKETRLSNHFMHLKGIKVELDEDN